MRPGWKDKILFPAIMARELKASGGFYDDFTEKQIMRALQLEGPEQGYRLPTKGEARAEALKDPDIKAALAKKTRQGMAKTDLPQTSAVRKAVRAHLEGLTLVRVISPTRMARELIASGDAVYTNCTVSSLAQKIKHEAVRQGYQIATQKDSVTSDMRHSLNNFLAEIKEDWGDRTLYPTEMARRLINSGNPAYAGAVEPLLTSMIYDEGIYQGFVVASNADAVSSDQRRAIKIHLEELKSTWGDEILYPARMARELIASGNPIYADTDETALSRMIQVEGMQLGYRTADQSESHSSPQRLAIKALLADLKEGWGKEPLYPREMARSLISSSNPLYANQDEKALAMMIWQEGNKQGYVIVRKNDAISSPQRRAINAYLAQLKEEWGEEPLYPAEIARSLINSGNPVYSGCEVRPLASMIWAEGKTLGYNTFGVGESSTPQRLAINAYLREIQEDWGDNPLNCMQMARELINSGSPIYTGCEVEFLAPMILAEGKKLGYTTSGPGQPGTPQRLAIRDYLAEIKEGWGDKTLFPTEMARQLIASGDPLYADQNELLLGQMIRKEGYKQGYTIASLGQAVTTPQRIAINDHLKALREEWGDKPLYPTEMARELIASDDPLYADRDVINLAQMIRKEGSKQGYQIGTRAEAVRRFYRAFGVIRFTTQSTVNRQTGATIDIADPRAINPEESIVNQQVEWAEPILRELIEDNPLAAFVILMEFEICPQLLKELPSELLDESPVEYDELLLEGLAYLKEHLPDMNPFAALINAD